jgi:F-type H+-transporting ATPase subunit a
VEHTQQRRPIKRWLLLLVIIGNIIAVRAYPPLRPHIQLPPEQLFPIFGNFYLTNTLVATAIVDILLLLMGFFFFRSVRSGKMVLTGVSGVLEFALEALYNLTESTAGKWAKTIFPWFATIVLVVLLANWMEVFPGVDSIGLFEPDHVHVEEAAPAEGGEEEGEHHDAFAPGGPCTKTVGFGITFLVGGEAECASAIVPYVRVASTDLNFTAAIAVVSVVMTQVIGVRALGLGYFTKFFNTKGLFTKPVFGVLDFAVGFLELISEFSKILSFSFRLFGNVFAGSVLLFVIGSLVPVFAQSAILVFEFLVGLIQAMVFGLLTMIFMSVATQGHGDEHGAEH